MKSKKTKTAARSRRPRVSRPRRTNKHVVRYDEALPAFTNLVRKHLGPRALKRDCFLRNAEGNLTYVVRGNVPKTKLDALSKAAKAALPAYTAELTVTTPDELFDEQLKEPNVGTLEFVGTVRRPQFVRLVERRIVGQDWVRGISEPIKNVPPIMVFASHKGGVGRSTALAIAATEFARRGHTILTIDADLEAPGLGEMFVPENEQPMFGTLDYFVENGHGTVDGGFIDLMRSSSSLTHGRRRGSGRVFVVPAVGRQCRQFPQNVIGKISRAYLEDVSSDGSKQYSLLDQMRQMIVDLSARHRYDAIFIDARAGLNETTAATVQGLGADILFFGVDTPQTWDGYRYFLAHLARFKPLSRKDDWRFRLKMVHAKATPNKTSLARFRDNAFELFAEGFYDEVPDDELGKEGTFGFDLDDPTAPHFGWPIYMNEAYYEFDPVSDRTLLDPDRYLPAFGEFIQLLGDRLGLK